MTLGWQSASGVDIDHVEMPFVGFEPGEAVAVMACYVVESERLGVMSHNVAEGAVLLDIVDMLGVVGEHEAVDAHAAREVGEGVFGIWHQSF